jgi:uncharacterized protein (DUF924 family)
MDEARLIRDFWFGKVPLTPETLKRRMQLWFGGEESPDIVRHRDELIRAKFSALIERAANGELASWADGPRRRLSLIVLLDQFPRNIYRGTSKAFAHDEQALGLALSGMNSGADAALDPAQRIFFYMPLQHAESLEVQDESVAAYRRLVGESPEALRAVALESCLKYAEGHRDVIRQFGRFPHRNRVLGRLSTPDEQVYLDGGAERFGQ